MKDRFDLGYYAAIEHVCKIINTMLAENDRLVREGHILPHGTLIPFIDGVKLKEELEGVKE